MAKICIVVFLASYLNEHREVLVVGRATSPGSSLPPLKHLGPLLVVWGAAMLHAGLHPRPGQLADVLRRLPGADLRRDRPDLLRVIGLAMFVVGAWFFAHTIAHVQERFDIWLDPVQRRRRHGLPALAVALRAGRRGAVRQGLGDSLVQLPGCHGDFPDRCAILPAPHTDFIYAVIVDELGLFGGAAVVLIYALIAERGFKTAILAEDGFSKLLATGLTAIFALQAFVIIGGVTRVIPLTGVTLPFISYGGSSIVANFILLALLLLISDKAPTPGAARRARRGCGDERPDHQALRLHPRPLRAALRLHLLLVDLRRRALKANPANRRPLLEEQRIKRGDILAADGS